MRTRTSIGFLLAAAAALTGCDSLRLARGRKQFYANDPNLAAETLAPLSLKRGRNEVLYAMERGTALHTAGRLDEANAEFLKAADGIKDWETKSVSKELAALAYSDAAKPYRGAPHEQLLVHAFLMTDFFAAGRANDALVEARRAVEILKVPDRPEWAEDPFTRFLTALAFDIRGAADDAYIEYRKTAELAPGFPHTKAPLLRLARATGRADDIPRWQALPGEASDFTPGGGILVAIVQTGGAPKKVQRQMFLPPHNRFVVPALEDRIPATRGAFVRAAGRSALAFPLTDVVRLAHAHLDDQIKAITARETGRQVASEFVARGLQKSDAMGGFADELWLAAWAALRVADTRSWETLPGRLQVAVLPLPAGTHDVEVRFLGHDPAPIGLYSLPGVPYAGPVRRFTGVEIREGRHAFVAARGL